MLRSAEWQWLLYLLFLRYERLHGFVVVSSSPRDALRRNNQKELATVFCKNNWVSRTPFNSTFLKYSKTIRFEWLTRRPLPKHRWWEAITQWCLTHRVSVARVTVVHTPGIITLIRVLFAPSIQQRPFTSLVITWCFWERWKTCLQVVMTWKWRSVQRVRSQSISEEAGWRLRATLIFYCWNSPRRANLCKLFDWHDYFSGELI